MTPISLNQLMPKSQLMMVSKGIQSKEQIAPTNQLIESFSTALQKHLKEVNNLSINTDKLTRQLSAGEIDNIHTVMIAAEKAKIALSFTLAMRDKIIRAYEDTLAMGGR